MVCCFLSSAEVEPIVNGVTVFEGVGDNGSVHCDVLAPIRSGLGPALRPRSLFKKGMENQTKVDTPSATKTIEK